MSPQAVRHRIAIIITIVSANMLALAATDLYLPSVPYLPEILGTNIEGIQFTLVAFSAGFAVSQILFGAAGDLWNRRWILVGSLAVFVPASAWCALSGSVEGLIAARVLQGFAASASATLTVPMIKPLFDEARSVHAISVIGGVDAIIPAFAPILGAWIFAQFGWAANFWIVVILGVPILAAAIWYVPNDRPESHHVSIWPVLMGFFTLLRHRVFMGYAVSHGFSLAGLLAVVFSAPTLIVSHMGGGPTEYVYCQIMWVGVFLLAANATGRLTRRFDADTLIWQANYIQVVSAAGLLIYALMTDTPHWLGFGLAGVPYCIGLGMRGGAGFSRAIDAVPAYGARASSLIIFFSMALAGLATGAIAPFIEQGVWSAGAIMLIMSLAALALLPLIRSNKE
jgi:MFS transporter, DHA1 family, multidrug resistance protein